MRAASPPQLISVLGVSVMLLTITSGVTLIPTYLLQEALGLSIPVITAILLAWVVALTHVTGRNIRFVKSGLARVFPVLLVGSFFAFVMVEATLSIFTGIGQLVIFRILVLAVGTVMMLLGLLRWSRKGSRYVDRDAIKILVNPYVYLCLALAVGGLIAWLSLTLGVVQWQDWIVRDDFRVDAVTGRFRHSMPMFLSFILVGEVPRNLFGVEVFRGSGLSDEPNQAALFVAPALFLISITFNNASRMLRSAATLVMVLFLITLGSVTNWLALAILGWLWLLKRKQFALALVAGMIGAIVLASLAFDAEADYARSLPDSLDVATARLLKLKSLPGAFQLSPAGLTEDWTGVGVLGALESGHNRGGTLILSWVLMVGHMTLFSALALRLYLASSSAAPLGLAGLYMALHMLKDPNGVMAFPFYVFVLFLTAIGFVIHERERAERRRDSAVNDPSMPPAQSSRAWAVRRRDTT